MRIKMTKTKTGASDGIAILEYVEGKEYTVSDDLGRAFVGMGVAVELTIPQPAIAQEKAIDAAPKNRAIANAPKNKKAGQ